MNQKQWLWMGVGILASGILPGRGGTSCEPVSAAVLLATLAQEASPFWRQSWFVLLLVLVMALLVVLGIRLLIDRRRLRQASLVLAAEVREHQREASAARESEALYRSFIAASPDGVGVVDPGGAVVFASRKINEMLGVDPDRNLTGTSALEWFAMEERRRIEADIATVMKDQVVLDAPYTLVRPDGSQLSVEISGAALRGTDGKVAGIIAIIHDVTLRRQAQAEINRLNENLERRVEERTADLQGKSDELRDSQVALVNLVEDLNDRSLQLEDANEKLKDLDRLKSLFIASMSHELRTPLNSIIGFSSILLNEWLGPLTAEQKENLGSVLRSGKHLLSLVNDVIDVTKIEAGRAEVVPEDFDLNDLIREVVTLLEKNIRDKGLGIQVRSEPVPMHTDRKRLLQCVLNLASNAVKFTEKGSIRIGAGPAEDGRHIEITVSDTGIGMREEDLGKLFTPFVRLDSPLRTKVLGTGLGLYLTRKLTMEILKGEVAVSSTLGQGSRFVLRVPRLI